VESSQISLSNLARSVKVQVQRCIESILSAKDGAYMTGTTELINNYGKSDTDTNGESKKVKTPS
jgi:hypothetical protein